MDTERTRAYIDSFWDDEILPTLEPYVAIPAQSIVFDPDWEANGFIDEAVNMAYEWVVDQDLPGATTEIFRIPGRTPLLFVEVPGDDRGTVLLYGHLDKQPPMEGWEPDLGPWKPVFRDGKLYGRGGADDGYAVFASVAAVKALREQGLSHPRLVFVIECSEESGSVDLPAYMDAYEHRIGTVDLVVCLDSGCGDYERLWLTTSLRGTVAGNLRVDILREGVHSGRASGIVPSSFRIARELIGRLEDSATGEILPEALHVEIPQERIDQAEATAKALAESEEEQMPFVDGAGPISESPAELLINRSWRPALSVTGAAGMPHVSQAGNVLRPYTELRLSLRVPPTLDKPTATQTVKSLLEADPPYGAQVTFTPNNANAGWHAPPLAPWLSEAVDEASKTYFGPPAGYIGEGGTIPFMGMLGDKFPEAQFVITGVLGPASNAHGPNEFLHIAMGKGVTMAVAHMIHRFQERVCEAR
ncbi:MAG: peptidase M20 [Deltaproteobacteria bacterium]|nr:peptidase M20 [Deltaproteobacteria bacterium]